MADDKTDKSLAAAATGKPAPNLTPPKPVVPVTTLTPPKKPSISNIAKAAAPNPNQSAKVKPKQVEDAFVTEMGLRMAFLGTGQGGGKIAQSFWDIGYRRVGVFNTTDSDFDGLDNDMAKLSLDIGGAAKNMTLARNSMLGRDEKIRDLFSRAWGSEIDCVLVCVGLGGGSGSGTALPLITMARSYLEDNGQPARVGAIVSLPSIDEGQQVCRNAVIAFNELVTNNVSPIIVIDNDKVHELFHPPMSQLLARSNELVSQLFHLFNQLAAARSTHVTFDRSEFTELLDSGICVMGSADLPLDEISVPTDVSNSIQEQLANNVLADVDLRTGTKAGCIFVASDSVLDTYSKDFFAAGFTMLNRIVGTANQSDIPPKIHRGIYPGGAEGLQCYVMVSDLAPPEKKLAVLRKEAGLDASNKTPRHPGSIIKHLGVE